MKILHLSQLYYPAFGGVEIKVRFISEQLAKRGHEVSVFTANNLTHDEFHQFKLKTGILKAKETINGVHVRRFKVNPWKSLLFSIHTDQIRGGYRLQRMLAGEAREFLQHGPVLDDLEKAIIQYQPDVMVAFNNYPMTTYIASMIKKRYGTPFVVLPSTHTSSPWSYSDSLKEVYRLADCIIASTPFEQKYLIDLGVADSRIQVVPNSIDHHSWQEPRDESFRQYHNIPSSALVVSYIGRQIQGKGIEVLVDAMRLVWRQYPQTYLVLAGKVMENFESIINSRLDQLTPQERRHVIYINSFLDEDKKSIYDASNIFAMASNVDSFGNVYLEAWMSGLPVIACRKTPQESFIEHGKDGFLVDYASDQQLAERILHLIKDSDSRRMMGENGRQKVLKNHTLNIFADRIENIYHSVLCRSN